MFYPPILINQSISESIKAHRNLKGQVQIQSPTPGHGSTGELALHCGMHLLLLLSVLIPQHEGHVCTHVDTPATVSMFHPHSPKRVAPCQGLVVPMPLCGWHLVGPGNGLESIWTRIPGCQVPSGDSG